MNRPAARCKENNIEAAISIRFAGVPHQPKLRRASDALGVNRFAGLDILAGLSSGFDLDKNQNLALLRNNVDFANRRFVAPISNPIELYTQIERGQRFGALTKFLCQN